MRLLLIEDSARLRELVSETIRHAGWRIDAVGSADEALAILAVNNYDLFLLDLGLPDCDGLDLLRALRRENNATPVLVLTARGAIDERIAGLDAGADDYLTKPFNNGELLARIRALLRRGSSALAPVLEAGQLRFDLARHEVSCAGAILPMTPRERSVLEILMRDFGKVTSRRVLEHRLSNLDEDISGNAIDLQLSRLRKKLSACPAGVTIETVRGVGYLLREVSP